jgi:hypothetical protein
MQIYSERGNTTTNQISTWPRVDVKWKYIINGMYQVV